MFVKQVFTRSAALALALAGAMVTASPTVAQNIWSETYTTEWGSTIAEVIAAALTADDIQPEAYDILTRIVVAEEYGPHFAVLSATFPDETDSDQIVLIVGEDDPLDDDSGWGTVWRVEIKLQPRDQLAPYVIQTVRVEVAAG